MKGEVDLENDGTMDQYCYSIYSIFYTLTNIVIPVFQSSGQAKVR